MPYLGLPNGTRYTVSPDGRRVAVLESIPYPPRPRIPVLLLRFGSFCYDVTRRGDSTRDMRIGRLAVHDTRDGRLLARLGGLVAGEPRWSQDSRWLAGVRPPDDGHALWVLDSGSGIIAEPDLRVSSSLLNHSAGPPLWWADPATLITLRDAIDRTMIDPHTDIVAGVGRDDSAGPDTRALLAIAGAARVDLVTVDGLLIARHITVADASTSAAGIDVAVSGSTQQLAALLTIGEMPAPSRYCPWQPVPPHMLDGRKVYVCDSFSSAEHGCSARNRG
ncbi:MAG TPA: hypothetical protein VN969_06075 [Streptosporangiaceae bacterium]|nr:hypothetical protein [Streptosporangiaceae bacterium]